jgi:hypothetical protein
MPDHLDPLDQLKAEGILFVGAKISKKFNGLDSPITSSVPQLQTNFNLIPDLIRVR